MTDNCWNQNLSVNILGQMLGVAKKITHAEDQLRIYAQTLRLLARAGYHDQLHAVLTLALETAESGSDMCARARAVAAIGDALAGQRSQEALGIFQQALDTALREPEPASRLTTLIALLDHLYAGKFHAQTRRIIRHIQHTIQEMPMGPAVYQIQEGYIRILLKHKDVEIAEESLLKHPDGLFKIDCLGQIASAWFSGDEITRAATCIENIIHQIQALPSPIVRDDALRSLAYRLGSAGQLPLALEIRNQIVGGFEKNEATREICLSMIELDRIFDAIALFEQMTDVQSRGDTLKALVSALLRNRHHERAVGLTRDSEGISDLARSLCQIDIAESFYLNGERGKAIELVQSIMATLKTMTKTATKNEVYRALAVYLVQFEEIDLGLPIVQMITSGSVRDMALVPICSALARQYHAKRALQMAQAITNGELKQTARCNLIMILTQQNKLELANQELATFPPEARPQVIAQMALYLAENNWIEQALELTNRLSDTRVIADILLRVTRAHVLSKNYHEAVKMARTLLPLINALEDRYSKCERFILLAEYLIELPSHQVKG